MAQKRIAKKATKKKVVEKIVERIVYLDQEPLMSEVELAGALNVPKDDPQRKAVFQIISEEVAHGTGLTQGKAGNHGELGYATGWQNAMIFVKAELGKQYNTANDKLRANARPKEEPTNKRGY